MSPMNERLQTMRRRFVALTAASATAFGIITASAISAPAHADNRDLGKIILGIAAIALLADALDKKRDKKPSGGEVVVIPEKKPEVTVRVPKACRLDVSGIGHDKFGYTDSCLQSYGFRDLPYDCSVSARVYGRPERLFPASCLRQAGFKLGK